MHVATSGILPRKVGGDSAYDAHCNAYGRAHAHRGEYERRRSHFAANSEYIALHNSAAAASFSLGMNHFGDWSEDEFAAMKQVQCSMYFKLQALWRSSIAGHALSCVSGLCCTENSIGMPRCTLSVPFEQNTLPTHLQCRGVGSG